MSTTVFRPMKGAKISPEEFHLLHFPLYLSVKLDGIRCLVKDGKALTAALKPLPNLHVRNFLEANPAFEGFDGELVLAKGSAFNDVSSAFMSRDGEPDFIYWVFDYHDQFNTSFEGRNAGLHLDPIFETQQQVRRLPHVEVPNVEVLNTFLKTILSAGHEGVMLRRPDLPYKFGKASIKQGHLLKVKPVEEMECLITDFIEGEKNLNEATVNERGLTKRSSCKDGKVPNGTLGSMKGLCKRFGEITVSPGSMTKEQKQYVFDHQDEFRYKFSRFTFQEIGTVDKPRSPNHQEWRDEADMEPALVAELRSLLDGAKS